MLETRLPVGPPVVFLAVLSLGAAAAAPVAAAPPLYVRGGAGYGESGDVTVRDLDCASTEPPALFGCVEGSDGRPIGARGDLGASLVVELAAGLEIGRRTRVELAFASRAGLELDAEANFLGVEGEQAVRADADSLSALLVLAVDLGRSRWRLQPFATAGVGAARNEIEPVRYGFPGIAPDAVTAVRGGEYTDFAWMAGAGASYRLSGSLFLDLAVRYTDLGEVRTDAGEATIVRPRGTFTLDIAGTRADLETTEVTLGLRYRL